VNGSWLNSKKPAFEKQTYRWKMARGGWKNEGGGLLKAESVLIQQGATADSTSTRFASVSSRGMSAT